MDSQHCDRWKGGRLYEAEGEVVVRDHGKVGCKSVKLVKKMKWPKWRIYTDMEILFKELDYVHHSRFTLDMYVQKGWIDWETIEWFFNGVQK
jgi:alpha-N-acetylglucosamine transferase